MNTGVFFKKLIGVVLLIALAAGIVAAGSITTVQAGDGDVKNVILLIGDGMGYAHLTTARLAQEKNLNMDMIKSTGTVTTRSANYVVTDSAAAGTAIATGNKTNNGLISITPDGKRLKTVLEGARDKGKRTGLVTTTNITHATPAAFAAHVPNRDDELTIAGQMLQARIDVMLGGGRSNFLPVKTGGKRTDNRDLTVEAKTYGYQYATTKEELDGVRDGKVLGLFNNSHLNFEIDRDVTKEPSLAEMTEKAISLLDNKGDGFFLMVEGGRIDHAAHANDPAGVVGDVRAFDAAAKVALDYAKTNPHTLVIITGDHETGGMVIGAGGEDAKTDIGLLNKVTKTPGYMAVQIKKGSAIEDVLRKYASINDLSTEENTGIQTASNKALAIADVISSRTGIKFSTYGHTGVTLPVMATGKYEQSFAGLIDNTDIAKIIAEAMRLEL